MIEVQLFLFQSCSKEIISMINAINISGFTFVFNTFFFIRTSDYWLWRMFGFLTLSLG